MSNWQIIVAEATTNMVLNPSAETTGNFAAFLGGSMTRVSTYNRYGLWSYRIQTVADDEGGSLTLSALANAIHYATLRVRGTLPNAWDWSLDNLTYNSPTLLEQLDGNWALYGCQFPAEEAHNSTMLYICQNGAGSGDFYIDGIQVEAKQYWTTFADGDQQGCEWNGAEHASTSTRSASCPAGGRQRDLQDDYYLDVGGMIGTGVAPQRVVIDEYATLPGGEVNTVKILPRPFTLTGVVRGTGYADLHTKLDSLAAALMGDSGCQEVRLRYTGSTAHKEIAAVYEGGMEGSITAKGACYWQKMAVRLIADDPYWYAYGGTGAGGAGEAALLDTNDSATFRLIAGRLKSTGQWDVLGMTINPAGVNRRVNAILRGPNGMIYVGGDFTTWDGIANAHYVAMYNPQTDSWSTMGAAGAFNNRVQGLVLAPDGDTIYAGGNFTNVGGADGDYLAQYSISGDAWSPVAAGGTGEVVSLAIAPDGTLYFCGDFTNWDADGDADYIASWDGSSYSPVGTGADNSCEAVAADRDGNVYLGGWFANVGGVACSRVAMWDGSNWLDMNGGATAGNVFYIYVGPDNTVYIAGSFTAVNGADTAAACIASWNGTAWEAMAAGLNGSALAMDMASDGTLWVFGDFNATGDGGLPFTSTIAQWNGSSWAGVDANLPRTAGAYSGIVGVTDPVLEGVYDLYVGLDHCATGYYAGIATVTNNGTANVYPVIVVERSGGTSAKFVSVRNESTGKKLLFDYDLLDGEKLIVDLRPTRQSIVSSMFGSRPDAILANSDMGSFTLQPGDNQVTAFVNVAGGPTITAWMEWRTSYRGL